jgi:hypothetical protein
MHDRLVKRAAAGSYITSKMTTICGSISSSRCTSVSEVIQSIQVRRREASCMFRVLHVSTVSCMSMCHNSPCRHVSVHHLSERSCHALWCLSWRQHGENTFLLPMPLGFLLGYKQILTSTTHGLGLHNGIWGSYWNVKKFLFF